jgi:hypothetical protein
MLIISQFRMNNNINRIIGKTPFDLVLRFRPEMRINIEIATTKNNYNISGEVPAARREIKLRESNANLVRDI